VTVQRRGYSIEGREFLDLSTQEIQQDESLLMSSPEPSYVTRTDDHRLAMKVGQETGREKSNQVTTIEK
jgi:hypothetical protein